MKQIIEFVEPLREIYVEAHIADIHFGIMDPHIQYQILSEQFLKPLSEMNVLDIISINGDLFDHKFMANSDVVLYANYFIYDLIQICKMKNATLILINGTGSHDSDQLKMFYPYTRDRTVDVRIVINEAMFIYVKGKKILAIPELYNRGSRYYEELLFNSGMYDSCYMHGSFSGAIMGKNEPNLNSDREPIFRIEDFCMCKGPIISGHNHVYGRYKEDFYYSGSPLRWRFGEEEEKGFIILLHKPQLRKYIIHFEPIKSFRYDTVNLDEMLNTDPKIIIDYIESLRQQGIHHIRVKFTREDLEKIEILRNYYRTKSDVKIETDFEQQRLIEQIDQLDNKYRQYDYLFDKSLSSNEILVRYINQRYGTDYWTVDTLKSFLQELDQL